MSGHTFLKFRIEKLWTRRKRKAQRKKSKMHVLNQPTAEVFEITQEVMLVHTTEKIF